MNETTTTKTKKTEDRVEVFIPRGRANGDPNLFVSINGVNYLLPRGKTSFVPKAVAREINRARKAEEALHAKEDEMLEQAQGLVQRGF